ncbi:MAG: type II toxin-antitoxin system VapC family toxin [Alphaproteobacteria bacterium]|nr:type II toxin-antitoxin system VapC family toxin [Alphaproteobacteria bacterium]MBV9693697.1 type II toxin-antitoxin system VapC family toxin [Alphaproteobacteria bacterium]
MNSAILLDTCAAIWLVNNEPLKQSAVDAMDRSFDLGVALRVSPISAWEVGNLGRVGRFKSALSPQRWFERLQAIPGIQLCELTGDILLESSFLPGRIHKDPGDRIIAATAREFGYTVMTRDRALLDYGRDGHLSVLEC